MTLSTDAMGNTTEYQYNADQPGVVRGSARPSTQTASGARPSAPTSPPARAPADPDLGAPSISITAPAS